MTRASARASEASAFGAMTLSVAPLSRGITSFMLGYCLATVANARVT
jgi:hypothetical protein